MTAGICVILDVRWITGPCGVATLWQNALPLLIQGNTHISIVLVTGRPNEATTQLEPLCHQYHELPYPLYDPRASRRINTFRDGFEQAVYVNAFYHLPFGLGIPSIGFIHDVTHVVVPTLSPAKFRAYRWAVQRCLRRADVICTLSLAAASEIKRHFKATRDLLVTPPGVDSGPIAGQQREANTAVYVGNSRPHKDLEFLVAAFQDPALAGWTLSIAGASRPPHTPELGNVRWMGRIGANEVRQIYERCSCLVMASRSEGFCYPVAEALAYGMPVVASDRPVYREVGGEAISYYAPGRVSCFIDALLSPKPSADRLRAQAAKYSSARSADAIAGAISLAARGT